MSEAQIPSIYLGCPPDLTPTTPKLDLTGMRFGRLTAEVLLGARHRKSLYGCLCECGQRKAVYYGHLRSGKTRSCGCLCLELRRRIRPTKRDPLAGLNSLESEYRRGAFTRGLDWALSSDVFRGLAEGSCWYCGAPPQPRKQEPKKAHWNLVCNGVDRVDSARGYTEDNVVSCCSPCNMAKRALTQRDFIDLCTRVAVRRGSLH
jgi:hypothetical protein